jgi:hypothetical protein
VNSPRGEELGAFPGEFVSLKARITSDNHMRVRVGLLQQLDNASGGQPHIFEREVSSDDRSPAGSAKLNLSHRKS